MSGIVIKKDPYNTKPELPKLNGGSIGNGWLEDNLKWQIDYFRYTGIPQGLDGDHVVRTQMQVFY